MVKLFTWRRCINKAAVPNRQRLVFSINRLGSSERIAQSEEQLVAFVADISW
jgi:hypothetical protein